MAVEMPAHWHVATASGGFLTATTRVEVPGDPDALLAWECEFPSECEHVKECVACLATAMLREP